MTTPTPIPIVAIVEQPDGTFPDPERRVAPAASRYHAMQEAAATVLNHLVVSPIAQARLLMMMLNFYLDYKPTSAAFDQKFGNRPPPDLALINQYFLTSPPTIVLCSPADLDRGIPRNGVAWGTVLKGSPQPKSGAKSGEDDAESEAGNTDGVDMPVEEKNEVFMPIDLAERLEVITVLFFLSFVVFSSETDLRPPLPSTPNGDGWSGL